MLYCQACNKYIQQDGLIAYREGDICPECGRSRLIDKPEEPQSGLNVVGSANTIDAHHTEQHIKNENDNSQNSHNDSHDDKSTHINNSGQTNVNGDYHVNQYAAQKTDMEILQENKTLYLNDCRRAYEDNVLEQAEVVALERRRIELGLDQVTADSILESVKNMAERNARKTSLNPIARTKLKILTANLQKNEVKALMDQIDGLEAFVKKYEHDELSRKYFLVLAALKPEKCIELKENSKIDSYWKSFWSYAAYIKVGQVDVAEDILATLDRFADYPEDNMTVLAVAGALMRNKKEDALEYLDAVVGDYTPALQCFVDSIYLLLKPEMAQEMGANESTCAFYLVNFFGQKDPKAKAEEEARLKKEAEEKAKAEAERLRKEEEERQRIAAEEEKRRREEEERLRKEEERRRKEEEARRAKDAADAEARKHVTYEVIVSGVRDKGKAEKNLADIMGWHSGDCRKKLSRTPFAVKSFRDNKESAIDLCVKLSTNGMMSIIKGKNGLNEVIDCSDILAQVQNLVFEENERQRKAEAERLAELRLEKEREEVERKKQAELEAKRKEAQEKLKRELAEAEKKRKEEEEKARRTIKEYKVIVIRINDSSEAKRTLGRTLGLRSYECLQKMSSVPFKAKSFTNNTEAPVDLCVTLCTGGMTSIIKAINGLDETVDCFDLMSQVHYRISYEQDRKQKEEEAAKKAQEEKRRQKKAKAEANFHVNYDNVHFSAQGETKRLAIYCDRKVLPWTFSALPDNWAIVEDEEGTKVKITVLPNTGSKERSDYFKVKCGSKEIRVDIIQEANTALEEKLRQEEARRKAEADRKAAEQAKARQNKTYKIKITKVKSMMFAMGTLRGLFGWDVTESKSRLAKLPIEFKTSNENEAKNMYTKLRNGGLEVSVSSVNGLGEVQNNCF